MQKENLKRLAAFTAAAALSISMLTACGSDKGDGTTANGNGTDAVTVLSEDELAKTALTVNDTDLTAGEMQYYIYNAATMTAYDLDRSFSGDFDNFDWSQKLDGKPIEEVIIDTAVENAVSDIVAVQKGRENGIEITEDEVKSLDSDISSYSSQYGEDIFILSMNAMAINNADDYKNLYKLIMGAQKVDEDVQKNIDKYAADKEELKKYKSNDKVTVQHILIMNDSEKHENPEETINAVLERAKAGEDFSALMTEFNEDPGETAAGYTFGPGEMVPEFEEASFNLDYDQISDVVKSDYGYHIIKRLVGTAEITNSWKEGAKIKRADKVLSKISPQKVVAAASNASKKMQEWSRNRADAQNNANTADTNADTADKESENE